jgi:hypothetical protein
MVFHDSKGVQADSIGKLDLLQVAQSIRGADREACVVVSCGEAVNANSPRIVPLARSCWLGLRSSTDVPSFLISRMSVARSSSDSPR